MDPAAIIDRLAPGARVTDCVALTGGVSAEVHAVTFVGTDGTVERVVVRRHRTVAGKPEREGRAAREHALLTLLYARGLQVPRPRLFVAPVTLVQDFVDGNTSLPPDAGKPLARALAAIHAIDPAGLPDLPPRNDPLPELLEWLPGLGGLARACTGTTSHAAGAPRLLHGDYWPGNVLWQQGRLAAVLDWEDAAVGDPLSDLACARVELACMAGEALARQFTAEYLQLNPLGVARLPIWDLYVSTAALRYMDQWGLAPDALAARRATTLEWQAHAVRELGLA